MLNVFLFGLLSTSSLVLGGLLGIGFSFGKRTLGAIMAFGAGVLLSAIAYELILDAVKLVYGSGVTAVGMIVGAFTYLFSGMLIERYGGSDRKAIGGSLPSNLIVPLVLATILDGIPESMVIGLGMFNESTVSVAVLVAIFISNIPEAMAGTAGMRSGGWSSKRILLLWLLVAVVCALAAPAGYALAEHASKYWTAFFNAFAAGAILMMLANTMMPEAYTHGGKLAGVFTVLGFMVSVAIVLLGKA